MQTAEAMLLEVGMRGFDGGSAETHDCLPLLLHPFIAGTDECGKVLGSALGFLFGTTR